MQRLGLAAALAILTASAASGERLALPAPGSGAWEPLAFRSIERHTVYTPGEIDGVRGVRAVSECGASALILSVEDVDLRETPELHWRWRVEEPLDVADERQKSGDDFAARVYVMFRFEPERASWLERARHRLGQALFGAEPPGTALSFVWSSAAPPGGIWTNPYSEESRMVALVRGPAADGAWRSEAVDLPARYRAAFGREPPPLLGIGLMTDADQTCQRAVAWYADFAFETAGGPAASEALER